MARNGADGLASINPTPTAPDNLQRLDVSARTFGGDVGAAMSGFGNTLENIGDKGMEVFGQVQVDDQLNKTMKSVNGTLENFRKLEGGERLRAQKQTTDEIEEHIRRGRTGLSIVQQQSYDRATENYRNGYVNSQISQLADAAGKEYTKATNSAALEVALQNVANVADDDGKVAEFAEDARAAAVRQLQADGMVNADTLKATLAKADRAVYKTQVEILAQKDPERALALTEKHREVLGADYAQINASLRTRVNDQKAEALFQSASVNTVQRLGTAPEKQNTNAVREAILEQESGNRDAAPKSVNGAIGPGQIMPDTFARYARPGEVITDPMANRAVAGRIVDDLAQKFQGDPERIAVGYFSGEGNVAPIGAPTPWLQDVRDGNGKAVSSYVADITGRVKGPQADQLAAKAGVFDSILASDATPQVKQIALTKARQQFEAAQVASMSQQAAVKIQTDQAIRQVGDLIAAGKPVNVRATLPWATEAQVRDLEEAQKKRAEEVLNGSSADYGPGYADVHAKILSTGAGKIVNQEQLIPLWRSGALNTAGWKAASAELKEINEPGAEAERALNTNFYDSMRKTVQIEFEGDNYVSPERREAWNKALPLLQKAIREGKEKGLTSAQLLDPGSKDYVGKILGPPGGGFIPSAAEQMKAQINRDNKNVAAQAAAKPFDIGTIKTLDDAVAAYESHKITLDQARALALQNPSWGIVVGGPPRVPVVP